MLPTDLSGPDNLIFISILTNKLPEETREKARRIGIGLALGTTSAFFLLAAALIFTLPDRSGQALEA